MDFKEILLQLSEKIVKQKDQIMTEEATKIAFVLPLIQALGYDIFNPFEVEPELTCDVGTKKGEKIDYAIKRNGSPILLLECKHWVENLDLHANQLFRYYVTSDARFAILTNGIQYRFFTDSEKPNIMDARPFFEVDITDMNEYQIEQLRKFHKDYFNEQFIMETIPAIKYINSLVANYIEEIKDLKDDIGSLRIIHNQELGYISTEADRVERKLNNQLEQSQHELDTLSKKISKLEEEKRVREETLLGNMERDIRKVENDEALIDFLNMPVPPNWLKMSCKQQREYWLNPNVWTGKPRDFICTPEVAREFYGEEREKLTGADGRRISDAIRRTGLFTQDGGSKRFGEYGSCLAWVRKATLVRIAKDGMKTKKSKEK